MAGWKVALTLPSQYEPMKLSGPVFAGIYKSGVRPDRRGVREGLAAEGRHRMRDGGAHVQGRDGRRATPPTASRPTSPTSIAAPRWSRTATPMSPS